MRLTVPGVPTPWARPRITTRGAVPHGYTTANVARATDMLRAHMRVAAARGGPFPAGVPLRLDMQAYFPTPKRTRNVWPCVRPDLDNFVKIILDSGNGILYDDDAQVCQLYAEKRYSREPRLVIAVIAI